MKLLPLLIFLILSGFAGSGVFRYDEALDDNTSIATNGLNSMDASHFIQYQNDSHINKWYEWWYFNVKNGSKALLIYFFTFGNLNSLYHMAGAIAYFFDGNESHEEFIFCKDPYLNFNEFNISIGKSIAYEENDTYYIHFFSHDSWINLSMRTKFIPFGGKPSYFDSWQWGAWYVAVPYGDAEVDVIIGENEYEFKGKAYHDHNWGISKFRNFMWDWGEFGCDEFAIIYGIAGIGGRENGGIHFVNETSHYAIEYKNASIDYRKWKRINLFWKPSEIYINGNSTIKIEMNIEMLKYYIIGLKNFGFPYMVGKAHLSVKINEKSFIVNTTGFYEHHTPPLKKYL